MPPPPVLLSCQLLHHSTVRNLSLPLYIWHRIAWHAPSWCLLRPRKREKFKTNTACSARRLHICFIRRTFLSPSFASAIRVAYGSDGIADQPARLGRTRFGAVEIRRWRAERGVCGWRALSTVIVKEWSALAYCRYRSRSHWSGYLAVLACT